MPDNVISLAQHFRPKTNAVGDLAYGFASARRDDSDVYWLKENSELLSILECTNQTVSAQDLECYSAFYRSLPDRIAFFPQYYRFLTSIALDLEALGFDGGVAAQLCAFVDRHALPETELSDLQRAEALRLLARRGFSYGNDAALRARLHSFMDQSRAFAVPNRKMAYELTHIVFYLSEYGRRDPELSAQAVQSLMYTGILAHLEENADLLSEICVALRYAGQIPPAAWEQWIATVLRGFDRKDHRSDGSNDHYHEYLVVNWAGAQMGMPVFQGPYGREGQAFYSPVAPLGAMRALSETLFQQRSERRATWGAMEKSVTAVLPEAICAHLADVIAASDQFESFFEHFARAETPAMKSVPRKQIAPIEIAR